VTTPGRKAGPREGDRPSSAGRPSAAGRSGAGEGSDRSIVPEVSKQIGDGRAADLGLDVNARAGGRRTPDPAAQPAGRPRDVRRRVGRGTGRCRRRRRRRSRDDPRAGPSRASGDGNRPAATRSSRCRSPRQRDRATSSRSSFSLKSHTFRWERRAGPGSHATRASSRNRSTQRRTIGPEEFVVFAPPVRQKTWSPARRSTAPGAAGEVGDPWINGPTSLPSVHAMPRGLIASIVVEGLPRSSGVRNQVATSSIGRPYAARLGLVLPAPEGRRRRASRTRGSHLGARSRSSSTKRPASRGAAAPESLLKSQRVHGGGRATRRSPTSGAHLGGSRSASLSPGGSEREIHRLQGLAEPPDMGQVTLAFTAMRNPSASARRHRAIVAASGEAVERVVDLDRLNRRA